MFLPLKIINKADTKLHCTPSLTPACTTVHNRESCIEPLEETPARPDARTRADGGAMHCDVTTPPSPSPAPAPLLLETPRAGVMDLTIQCPGGRELPWPKFGIGHIKSGLKILGFSISRMVRIIIFFSFNFLFIIF